MKSIFITLFSLSITFSLFSQDKNQKKYPNINGFIGTAIPILSLSNDGLLSNFDKSTTLAFPFGLNLNKSKKFSYSVELDPIITFKKEGSSLTNLAILPGILFHTEYFTYGIRATFEINGRYGASFSLLRNIFKGNGFDIVIGLPLDLRFGNSLPSSVGTGLIVVVVI